MGKHYAISDLHGCYNIYEQVCAMLKPDDIVFFLGDAGDRGYDNWHLIKDIYTNPQWIYLKGNHEELAVKALKEMQNDDFRFSWDAECYLWEYNGGGPTFDEFLTDEADYHWVRRLDNLPLNMTYTNTNGDIIHLSHAGFNPDEQERDYLWDRSHFFKPYWTGADNEYEVHGHTPILFQLRSMRTLLDDIPKYEDKPNVYCYCDNHKFNIDNGVFFTGYTVLFDLDTFEAIPLYDKSGKVKVDLND